MKNRKIIAVIGGFEATPEIEKLAYETGKEIAKAGFILVCGGMKGVMEAACKGAKDEKGLTIGILPGKSRQDANPYIDIPIITAMSHARNAIIVRTADAVIAVGGKFGTLSEIGLAKAIDKPVFGIKTWDIEGINKVDSPKIAIELVNGLLK
ncbi:MAG: TIGR00725 family protein [Elusimicrobia bacterium]|nr:TIGR00725 family protein [Candidatus Liberimonas magnetica]